MWRIRMRITTGLPLAAVVNESGRAAIPNSSSAALALKKATLNSDLSANLLGVFKDRAFIDLDGALCASPPFSRPDTTALSYVGPIGRG